MLDTDRVQAALTLRMTGAQLAEQMGEITKEVIPALNALHLDGLVTRTVDSETHVARFAPIQLGTASVHQLEREPMGPLPIAA